MCVKYRFLEGEIHWKIKINQSTDRHTVPANCIVLWWEGFKQSKPDENKKVLYKHENSLQLADLFLVWTSKKRSCGEGGGEKKFYSQQFHLSSDFL